MKKLKRVMLLTALCAIISCGSGGGGGSPEVSNVPTPITPGSPTVPVNPGTPTNPGVPGSPATPGNPGTPGSSTVPVTPPGSSITPPITPPPITPQKKVPITLPVVVNNTRYTTTPDITKLKEGIYDRVKYTQEGDNDSHNGANTTIGAMKFGLKLDESTPTSINPSTVMNVQKDGAAFFVVMNGDTDKKKLEIKS